MSRTLEQVLTQAMELPGEDRLQLAEALLTSIEPSGSLPFDLDWLTEAKRRAAAIDSGNAKLSSWPEVRDRVREKLRG